MAVWGKLIHYLQACEGSVRTRNNQNDAYKPSFGRVLLCAQRQRPLAGVWRLTSASAGSRLAPAGLSKIGMQWEACLDRLTPTLRKQCRTSTRKRKLVAFFGALSEESMKTDMFAATSVAYAAMQCIERACTV